MSLPPPPPPAVTAAPPKTAGRANLLKSIEGFKKGKLKKAETVEKSAPLQKPTASATASTGSSNESSSSSSMQHQSSAPMGMALGGLFAGGMPSLRKTGREGAATMLPQNNAPPSKPVSSAPKSNETEKPLPTPPVKPTNTVSQPPVVQVPPTPTEAPPQIPKTEVVEKPQVQIPVVQQQPQRPVVPVPAPVQQVQQQKPPLQVAQPPQRQMSQQTMPQQQQRTIPPLSRNQGVSSTSLLPKLTYKIEIPTDEMLEEHPSIPTYQNPLVLKMQPKTTSSNNIVIPEEPEIEIEQLELDIPIEEAPDIVIPQSLEVVTMDIDTDVHQPKAACELQPKRQQLIEASRRGDEDTIMYILQQEPTQMRRKELLNGLDLDTETNKKTSPLHTAIEYGHLSVVATLLSQGASTLLEDAGGNTAIHTACKTQHSTTMDIFSFLMNAACNVKAQNRAGNTPLHIACMLNENKTSLFPEMVYTLVTNPFADLLLQNSQGLTPLMYASQSGDLGVVKLILSRLSISDCIKLLNMKATIITPNGPKKVNATSMAADRDTVGSVTKLLIEYGAHPSPDNQLQNALGPLLCNLSVPPPEYPSNRFARILTSGIYPKPAIDNEAISCLKCEVRFSVVTRRVRFFY